MRGVPPADVVLATPADVVLATPGSLADVAENLGGIGIASCGEPSEVVEERLESCWRMRNQSATHSWKWSLMNSACAYSRSSCAKAAGVSETQYLRLEVSN